MPNATTPVGVTTLKLAPSETRLLLATLEDTIANFEPVDRTMSHDDRHRIAVLDRVYTRLTEAARNS